MPLDETQKYLMSKGYSLEEIEVAQERLATMSLEDLLAQDAYILKLESNMPEAPASLNFFGVSSDGWNLQFTLRSVDEANLMDRFIRFTDYLNTMNIVPKQVGQPAQPVKAQQDAQVNIPAGMEGDLDSPNISAFEVESLTHLVSPNGSHFLKVKGGNWTAYGFNAWPEVVAKAGISIESLPFGEIKDIPPQLKTAWADTKDKKKIVAFGA